MIADDHRFDGIGAVNSLVQTPSLDALAASGVSFRQAHIFGGMSGAVCIPARAALLTGTNPFRASVHPRVDDGPGNMTINPAVAVLPAVLRQAGYHTYMTGKWHNDKASFARSFAGAANIFFGGMSDHYAVPIQDFDPAGAYPREAAHPGEQHSSELFADTAIRFLRDYDGDDPYFLYVAFTAPHDPRTAPPDYAALYDPATLPLPSNFLPEHPFDNGDMRGRDEKLAPWLRTPEIVRQHLADYYAMISHLDAQVGRVLAAATARPDGEQTIVVYTADHGLAVGQHGLFGKQNLYEHSIRVPMIVRGPDLPAGRQSQALVYPADLFPALCALTDTPVPSTVETKSLLPLVTGQLERLRDSVCAVYKDVQRSIDDGTWKLIRYYRAQNQQAGTDRAQFFHLTEDPWEMNDLSGDRAYTEHMERLAAGLEAWQRAVGDPVV